MNTDENNISTIKCCLKSCFNWNNNTFPFDDFVASVNQCVEYGSRISHFYGQFMKQLLVFYFATDNANGIYGDIGDLMADQTFHRQCCNAHYNEGRVNAEKKNQSCQSSEREILPKRV